MRCKGAAAVASSLPGAWMGMGMGKGVAVVAERRPCCLQSDVATVHHSLVIVRLAKRSHVLLDALELKTLNTTRTRLCGVLKGTDDAPQSKQQQEEEAGKKPIAGPCREGSQRACCACFPVGRRRACGLGCGRKSIPPLTPHH
jgi:hypothetical protein